MLLPIKQLSNCLGWREFSLLYLPHIEFITINSLRASSLGGWRVGKGKGERELATMSQRFEYLHQSSIQNADWSRFNLAVTSSIFAHVAL